MTGRYDAGDTGKRHVGYTLFPNSHTHLHTVHKSRKHHAAMDVRGTLGDTERELRLDEFS